MPSEETIVTNSSRRRVCNVKLIFSLIGLILGILAFLTFFIMGNYEAGVWGFASFLCASIVFYLHYLSNTNQLRQKYEPADFLDMQIIGVVATAAGFCGVVWYTFRYFYEHVPVFPVSTSVIISIVWAFMTFKWGAALTYYTAVYKKDVVQELLL